MAVIGTRIVGLGNHHTARTGAGTVSDVSWGDEDDATRVQVDWDSGDTTWVDAEGVKPKK